MPDAVKEELVYSNTLEGLRLALRNHGVDPAAVDLGFRGIGIDFAKLIPAYARLQFIDALRLSAKLAYPELPPNEAFRGVGRLVVDGYVETIMGKAVHAAARLMGPMWVLKRMTRTLRTSDNCTEASASEISPTEVTIWMNDHLGCFGYYEGIYEATVRVSGGRDGVCTMESTSGERAATYRVRWSK